MSQIEETAELKRENEALKKENEALKKENEASEKRAAERYTNMLHANRRAERTEQALEKEKWERLGSELKAMKMYNIHKAKITVLESDVMQAQELQVANVRLEVELAQQKDAATRELTSKSNVLKHIQAKYEADKQKCMEQTEKKYQQRLVAKDRVIEDGVARQAALFKKLSKELESARRENERLQLQLKQSQQALEWQKEQKQQQSTQRSGYHGPQMAAGVHAGFSVSTQQSPAQAGDQARKRKRLNSTGHVTVASFYTIFKQANVTSDAGLPTPERQRGFESISTTPSRRRTQGGATQFPQNPSTPTRTHHRPNSNASSPHSVQQYWAQEQEILLQAQRNGTQQLFTQYFLRLNNAREQAGLGPVNIVQAWSPFSQCMASSAAQQLPVAMPAYGGVGSPWVPAQGNTLKAMDTNIGQFELRSPLVPNCTFFGEQSSLVVNTPLPSSNQTNDFWVAQQTQQSQNGRQPVHNVNQTALPSVEMSNQASNSMPTLTAGYNTTSTIVPPNDALQTQAKAKQVRLTENELLEFPLLARLASQLQDGGEDISLVDSQGVHSRSGPVDQSQIPGWASATSFHGNSSHGENSAQASYGDSNALNLSNDLTYTGFSPAANESPAQLKDSSVKETSHSASTQQQATNHLPQQTPQQSTQQLTLDPRLLHSTTPQSTSSPFNFPTNAFSPINSSPSHQRQPSQVPSIPSIQSSHPATSRKAPAASTPLSGRSTPAPSGPVFPVCLHCHEFWWNASCDAGEPCQNCALSGSACERPKCHGEVETGTCGGGRCARVHEGDERFASVVVRPKTLKRRGKKEQRGLSPVEVARGQ